MTTNSSGASARKPFTGWHMTAVLCAFFGVVIAVNLVNAYYAARTFGGMVVENSYVASQKFNGWLEQAREEKALGWKLAVTRAPSGRLDVQLASAQQPMTDAHISAIARHPLGRLPERPLTFRATGQGHYESNEALPLGRWIVHLEARAHGKMIHHIVDLQ